MIKVVGQPTILEPLPSVEPERITSQFNELQMNEIMKMWSSHHTQKNVASSFYIFHTQCCVYNILLCFQKPKDKALQK